MVRERGLGDELGFCSWERVGASGLLIWLGASPGVARAKGSRVHAPPWVVSAAFWCWRR